MQFSKIRVASIFGAALSLCTVANAQQMPAPDTTHAASLAYFTGTWNCAGEFPATGMKIASTIRFDSDLRSTAIVKHHDDTPPAAYHAMEVWTYSPRQKQFVSTITDEFGGVRTFTSPGWDGSTLAWTGDAAVKPPQQFVYTNVDDHTFKLDWRVSRNGGPMVVGDTLTCTKA